MMNVGHARPYRSELRERQAAETRRRVVEAAIALFSRQGYPATTFAQIAKEAGVSVETAQKHGPKAALLRHAVELAAFGVEGETDVFATGLGQAMLGSGSATEFASVIGDAILAINAPSADLWMTVTGASHGHEELKAFQAQMLGSVRGQVERALRFADQRGWLRGDVPFDELVEAACIVTSVETYVRFVQLDGKSLDAYRGFVTRTLQDAVLAS